MDLDVVFGTFPQLTTKRLALRELRPGDAESLLAVLGDEEIFYAESGEIADADFFGSNIRRLIAERSGFEGLRAQMCSVLQFTEPLTLGSGVHQEQCGPLENLRVEFSRKELPVV